MRQVVLDTETTGLKPEQGHRIIEIGCVEICNRKLTNNHYHVYINPEREVEKEAFEVHGISNEFLSDKPVFADIVDEFLEFIRGSELIIHNAPFDTNFIDHEFRWLDQGLHPLSKVCTITDTLAMARKMHVGQRNNLDALCKRYHINNSNRKLHGALLDADLLALVYLAMTGGQSSLFGDGQQTQTANMSHFQCTRATHIDKLKVIKANPKEIAAHEKFIKEFLE